MKTWEMLRTLAEDPKLKFKSDNKTVFVKEQPFCIGYYSDFDGKFCLLEMCQRDSLAEWELVREPVDFMTAVKAYVQGKVIECKCKELLTRTYIPQDGETTFILSDQYNCSVSAEEILHGTWYIKD